MRTTAAGRARDPLVLAIDLGTSSIKVGIVDRELRVRATASARHTILGDPAGKREHDPRQTWSATLGAIRRAIATIDRSSVLAISVTGPRGSVLVTDRTGEPRTNALSWQDRRAGALTAAMDPAQAAWFRTITGAAFDPAVGLPKLLWLRSTIPELFDGGWRIATPQSDVLRRFGAVAGAVDRSVAGHLGLLDVRALDWSGPVMDRFGIPASAMPSLVSQGAAVGTLSAAVARRLGLHAGLPLVAAGSDGICSELGAGVVDPGQRYAYLGTASAVAGPVAAPDPPDDDAIILMPGSVEDRWRLVGLGMAGASARAWFMGVVAMRGEVRFDRIVERSPAGARGVLFLPTLAGATAPVRDPLARGVFAGLSLGSDRADLARAVLEGVGYELAWLDRAIGSAMGTSEVRLTGGGSRSTVWAQILADIFGAPLCRVLEPNPGLRGAAAYAWAALESARSVVEIARAQPAPMESFEPSADRRDTYDEALGVYAALRTALHDAGLDARLATPTTSGANRP